jgi:hypothetical protein
MQEVQKGDQRGMDSAQADLHHGSCSTPEIVSGPLENAVSVVRAKLNGQTLRSMLKRKQNRQSNQYQFTLNWPRLYHCSYFLYFEHVDTDDLNTGTLQQRTEYLRSFIFAGSDQVSAPPAAIEGSYVNIQSRRYRTR